MDLLDLACLDRATAVIHSEPFARLVAPGILNDAARPFLKADFPNYASAGFFPHHAEECGPAINALVAALEGPAFADAIGAKLGIEQLAQYPVLVTLCRSLNRRHGTIHTDSRSKVATALVYLNESWPADEHGGCLRFLQRIDSIDDVLEPELKPLYGNLAAFRRADNSFHGHLPYEGERRVIQIAWLTSEEEKRRKTQRGGFSRAIKKLFGALDRKLGAGRARDAAHPK